MKEKLINNLTIKTLDDGTTRGAFVKLVKKDFSAGETYDLYRLEMGYAVLQIQRSLAETDAEKAGHFRNLAVDHVNKCMNILTAEMRVQDSIPADFLPSINKKTMRAWIAIGTFARMKTDYKTGTRSVDMKNLTMLQKLIECHVADVLNKRDSMTIKSNNRLLETIDKLNKKLTPATATSAPATSAPAETAPAETADK